MTERHLFLKGRSGTGKTTWLLSCLKPYWKEAGGFLTQRLIVGTGESVGFCLLPVENMTEPPPVTRLYEPGIEGVFIEKTPEGWRKYPEVFETMGAEILERLLDRPERYRFFYIDEAGGVELKVKPFMERLERLLDGPVFCIGVLKHSDNLAAMGTRVSLSANAAPDRNRLESKMEQRFHCRILSFAGAEDEKMEIRRMIQQRLAGTAEKECEG